MNILFRSHCDDILRSYVFSSVLGKRESDTRELIAEMEEQMRISRRALRKRIVSLENEKVNLDERIESLDWDVERLHLRIDGFEMCLQQFGKRLKQIAEKSEVVLEKVSESTPIESDRHMSDDYFRLMESYTQLRFAVANATSIDELGWVQI